MYVFCNQKLLTNIGTNKVRYRKYFEYNCTSNPDTLVPISYTDACTISGWPSDMKIGCDGGDGGDDDGDVDHPEAFTSVFTVILACLFAGFCISQVAARIRAGMRACVLLLAPPLPCLFPAPYS